MLLSRVLMPCPAFCGSLRDSTQPSYSPPPMGLTIRCCIRVNFALRHRRPTSWNSKVRSWSDAYSWRLLVSCIRARAPTTASIASGAAGLRANLIHDGLFAPFARSSKPPDLRSAMEQRMFTRTIGPPPWRTTVECALSMPRLTRCAPSWAPVAAMTARQLQTPAPAQIV